MTELRPFNKIMSELLEQSGLTRDQLSEKLSGMPDCPLNKEQSSAPGIDLINGMVKFLQPSIKQEMELFRSVAVLIAVDEKKKFSEMFYAYRKGFGLSLEKIGSHLSANLRGQKGDTDFKMLAALYETGAKAPTDQEIQALITIFGLENLTEISNFRAKVKKAVKAGIRLVDKDFTDELNLSRDKIAKAEQLLKDDTSKQRELIVGEAAKILMSKKEDK